MQEQGHEVFNIDYKGGDYTADLSTKEGRKGAIEAVYQRYPDGIDCFISNAGVGPTVPAATLFSLNYFAATELGGRITAFIEKKRGNCVMTASNSITFPYVRQDWVDMLTNIHDEDSFYTNCAGYSAPSRTGLLQYLKTCFDPLDALYRRLGQ